MASIMEPSNQQAKRRGKNTPEYQKVKESLLKFTDGMETIPDAISCLTGKFVEAGWLPTHARDISARSLIIQALNRIENDAKEHKVFIGMLQDIPGTDQIVTMLSMQHVKEESTHAESKEDFVLGKTGPKTAHLAQVECDSGYVDGSHQKIASPRANVHDLDVAAGGFNSERHQQEDFQDERVNDDKDVPIPTSGDASITTVAQQPKSEAVENSLFGVDTEVEMEEQGDQSLAVKPVSEISQPVNETPAVYLSTGMIEKLRELEILKKKNEELKHQHQLELERLKKQLKEETDEKNVLRQEKEVLQNQLQQFQENALKKKVAQEKEIEEKTRELQECKDSLSAVEREKEVMELEHKQTCTKLEEEISELKKQLNDEQRNTELETLRLEKKLCQAEKELLKQENKILEQEKNISELDKKISIDSKDAEIQKLKIETRELRRGRSISRSLSSLKIEEEKD